MKDKGLILIPGIEDKAPKINVGDKVKLIRPDKSELFSKIIGITSTGGINIMIENKYKKEDIPIDKEVWLMD
ncbi:MAG: hypothetical protein MI922_18930 [Bacteroidales bacterium]|nr:hypothetical protein [Bacteroidales bacterium]